jgi:hypothetical protein
MTTFKKPQGPKIYKKQRDTYEEYTHTKMPFGKYKGKWLSEIPDSYLKWGILKCDNYVATMFSIELQRRYPALRR